MKKKINLLCLLLKGHRKKLIVMRNTILILLISTFQVLATGSYAQTQKISLAMNDATIKEVLFAIEEQSEFYFLFNSELIDVAKKVNVHFEGEKVDEVLTRLFNDNEVDFLIKDRYIVLTPVEGEQQASAQQPTVSGKVTDSMGRPLPGVTVVVKGTTRGTVTNADGAFSLTGIPQDAVLQFSFVGMRTQEVEMAGRTNINITMTEETIGMDEVVVVGYGVQKRANLTGAVGQVNAEEIAARPDANISNSLQGMVPGLNIQVNSGDPTASPDINVRGFNSINGGSPLVLVDGIEGDISRVNPNDIESITVLKDAASAAIYGARGSFGVILITTKTGRSGDMIVNYTNNFGWTTPTTRTDFISDPYVYGKTVDAAIFGYNGTSFTGYNEMDWETIRLVSAGAIEPFHELQSNGTYKFFYNTNWYDYLFKKWQASQYHNVSISGGTDKLRAYLSGRVFERETINNIAQADMDRYNLKANLVFQPYEWIEFSNDIQFTHELDEDFGGYRNGYGGIWSTTTWYDLFPMYPNMIDGVPVDLGRGGSGGQGGAAAMEAGQNWRRFTTEELTNTFRVKINPLKGLELNLDYSNRFDNTTRTYRYNEFEYLTTDRLDLETVGINRLGEWRWKDKYKALNVFGTYTTDIADAHHFKLLLGYNQEAFDRDRVAAQSNGLLLRDMANLAFGTEMYNIEGAALLWAVQGYFGRFNYDYKGKYLLEVNARYDGSSRFPEGERWGLFPSMSAGWQINREKFWGPLEDIIPSMKLRASYGKLGNQSVGVNTFRQLMDLGRSGWLENGERLTYAGAPNPLPRIVSWESTRTIDVGADFGFLENRLFASFDWFEKTTEDMYLPGQPLPAVFGASEPRENYASLRNRGFELSLSYKNSVNLAGSPLRFNVTASVSNFKGVITKYDNPEGLMSTYWEGQELGQIWGYHIDGQFQTDEEALAYQNSFENPSNSLGNVYKYILNVVQNSEWNRLRAGDIKYVDSDDDGRIDRGDYTLEDHGDLRPIGNAMPKFPFGFNMNASWKRFDVSVAGAGVGQQHWYPTGDIFWGPYQRPYLSFIRADLLENAWTPENPGNTYPQIYRGYSSLGANRSLGEVNDYYLTNIGFLRVKNLTVGYTLPQTLTQKVKIQKLRVYFSGENMLTWRFGDLTKFVDPEQAGSAINYSDPGDAVGRADLRDYPMGKTYSFGVNVTL